MIVLAALAAVIVGVILLNLITPRPFVAVFRFAAGFTASAVKLGPFEAAIEDVAASEPIAVPVDGSPDATLTVYTPKGSVGAPRPIILYIHGGGWVTGTPESVSSYAQLLAADGYVVANLGYSLAPEYHYPTPIKQAAAAIDYLQAHAGQFRADPAKFFIAGNSAGAQIASQLGSLITNLPYRSAVGVPVSVPPASLRGLVLFNGVYDFDTVGRDRFPGFRMYAWSYTGQRHFEDFRKLDQLSTARNITSAYPATFLTAGDADPMKRRLISSTQSSEPTTST